MPASNFAFRTPFGCKLQEFTADLGDVQKKENWLVVEPNTEEGISDKQKAYCFTADADTREASIFFNFALGKVVGNDYYLLAAINGDSQQSFEVKIQKKEGEKWIEDIEKTKEFYKGWKESGCLVAYHVNSIWNLELLVKAMVEHQVMIKENIKCLFSKKEIPLDLLAKVADQYNAAIAHLKTGQAPKAADPEVFTKLKALNSSMGLPSIVLKDIELEDDFGETAPHPAFTGELPASVEALFEPKATTPYQKKDQKSYGMQPEQRMEFLFSNINNDKLNSYVASIMSDPNGLIKHTILCQITGLNIDLPTSNQVNTNVGSFNGSKPTIGLTDGFPTVILTDGSPDRLTEVDLTTDLQPDQTLTTTVETIEEAFNWNDYIETSSLTPKEKKKIIECLEECQKYTFINWVLYVKGMEIDASTTLQKSRTDKEVINLVCKTLLALYKVLTAETLNKNLEQLPAFLLHCYKQDRLEYLTYSQLKDLQIKLSDLDSRASLEEVDLSV